MLIDDADLLDDSLVLPALREVTALVDRDEGLVVAATNAVQLPTRFRGLDTEVSPTRVPPGARSGTARTVELLGGRYGAGVARLPGRALFVTRDEGTEVQVLLAGPSGGAVGSVVAGQHLAPGCAAVQAAPTITSATAMTSQPTTARVPWTG